MPKRGFCSWQIWKSSKRGQARALLSLRPSTEPIRGERNQATLRSVHFTRAYQQRPGTSFVP